MIEKNTQENGIVAANVAPICRVCQDDQEGRMGSGCRALGGVPVREMGDPLRDSPISLDEMISGTTSHFAAMMVAVQESEATCAIMELANWDTHAHVTHTTCVH